MNIKKAFSLVELLVAMAIIAVLISIAAFGINIVQRNSRDTKRRQFAQDLVVILNDINTANLQYPDSATSNLRTGEITFYLKGQPVGTYYLKAMDSKSWQIIGSTGNECSNQSFLNYRPNRDNLAFCIDFKNMKVGVRLEAAEFGGTAYVVSF